MLCEFNNASLCHSRNRETSLGHMVCSLRLQYRMSLLVLQHYSPAETYRRASDCSVIASVDYLKLSVCFFVKRSVCNIKHLPSFPDYKPQFFSHALKPALFTLMRLIYGFFWANGFQGGALVGIPKVRQTEKVTRKMLVLSVKKKKKV